MGTEQMCTVLACGACICSVCVCLATCILHLNVLWDIPVSLVICSGSVGAGRPGGMFTEINGVNICRVSPSCRNCLVPCPCPHPTLRSRRGWQEGSRPCCVLPPCATTCLLIVAQLRMHISHHSLFHSTLTASSSVSLTISFQSASNSPLTF